MSATAPGAIVAGPTLEPVRLTTPFTPPPELEFAGLGLTDVLVLPHDDHRGCGEATPRLVQLSAARSA